MQGVHQLTQPEFPPHLSDSGIQGNDSDLRSLSSELQQTLKIDSTDINKNDNNSSSSNSLQYNNKRFNNRQYHGGKKDHKNTNYRGQGRGYHNRSGGNTKKENLQTSTQHQQPHNIVNQGGNASSQQQSHADSFNDSGNGNDFNCPNVIADRFDVQPSFDYYQVNNRSSLYWCVCTYIFILM